MYQHCIEACNACAVACHHCATECLMEEDVKKLSKCIQLDLECGAFCWSAAGIMSLGSEFSPRLCQLCAEVCDACAAECEKHAEMGMDHCRQCAEACRKCADACREMAPAA